MVTQARVYDPASVARTVIDGLAVNGSARVVGWFSGMTRLLQTGVLNTYAFLMLFGILAGVSWVLWRFWP